MKTERMSTRCSLMVAVVLPWMALSSASADWQTYRGVTVWTQSSSKERTFTWSGTTDADGKAQGQGTYVVFFSGKKVVTYTGTMQAGRLTGHVIAIYHKTGQSYDGGIRNNSENGFGTMRDADGGVRTGRWVDGKLIELAADVPSNGPASVIPAGETSPPPRSVSKARPTPPSGVAALEPGIEPDRANTSPAEEFLYKLSSITHRYCLDCTYQLTPDESIKDAFWTNERAVAVAKLLESPLGARIPESLHEFCIQALTLDAALETIRQRRERGAERGRDDGTALIYKIIGGLPGTLFQGSDESQSVESTAFGMILGTIASVQEPETMLGQFREYKAKLDPHRRWAALLASLAADDPGVSPFAADPRTSDPTWHFLHNQAGGDAYFGNSRDLSRTAHGENSIAPQCYVGDVREGPIRVHFKKRGTVIGYRITFKGTKYGEVFVAHCQRGHFGIYGEERTVAWAARGLRDNRSNGKISYSNTIAGSPTTYTIGVWHLTTTGKSEDLDVDGDVLIYLAYQFPSEAEAAAHARDVYLH